MDVLERRIPPTPRSRRFKEQALPAATAVAEEMAKTVGSVRSGQIKARADQIKTAKRRLFLADMELHDLMVDGQDPTAIDLFLMLQAQIEHKKESIAENISLHEQKRATEDPSLLAEWQKLRNLASEYLRREYSLRIWLAVVTGLTVTSSAAGAALFLRGELSSLDNMLKLFWTGLELLLLLTNCFAASEYFFSKDGVADGPVMLLPALRLGNQLKLVKEMTDTNTTVYSTPGAVATALVLQPRIKAKNEKEK